MSCDLNTFFFWNEDHAPDKTCLLLYHILRFVLSDLQWKSEYAISYTFQKWSLISLKLYRLVNYPRGCFAYPDYFVIPFFLFYHFRTICLMIHNKWLHFIFTVHTQDVRYISKQITSSRNGSGCINRNCYKMHFSSEEEMDVSCRQRFTCLIW